MDCNVNRFHLKKIENNFIKNKDAQNPITQGFQEYPQQNEVISNDGSRALKNNFIGQSRVNFRGLHDDEATLKEKIIKELKSLESDYRDYVPNKEYVAYINRYLMLMQNYLSTVKKKEDLQSVYYFITETNKMLIDSDIHVNYLSNIFGCTTFETKKNIDTVNNFLLKTKETHPYLCNLPIIFEKISGSGNLVDSANMWFYIMNTFKQFNPNIEEDYAVDYLLHETPEHFKSINKDSLNCFLKILSKADKDYYFRFDYNKESNYTKLFEASENQIKNIEKYIINDDKAYLNESSEDLYYLSQLNPDEEKKIEPFIHLKGYSSANGEIINPLKGEQLYKIAKCNDKLYKALLTIIKYGKEETEKENNDGRPVYYTHNLYNFAKYISDERLKRLDDKLINKENCGELINVMRILAFSKNLNIADFMLNNNLNDWSMINNIFENSNEEKMKKIANSKFAKILVRYSKDDKIFKNILEELNSLSTDKLDKLESNISNEVIEKFVNDRIKTYIENKKNKDEEKITFEKATDSLIEEKSIIEKFILKKEYSPFIESAQKINSDELLILSKFLPNIVNKKNKDKINLLAKECEILINEKDSKGQPLFIDLKSNDNSEKGVFFGLINILDAKVNNPEKYKQLKSILNLIKQGKLPRHILAVMSVNGEITGLVNDDLQKMLNKKEIVESYDNNEKGLSGTKKGDVVEVKGKLFVNDGKKLSELKMDKKTYLKLFPPVERFGFSQGQIADCYLVSAIYDMMRNSDTRIMLYKMFEQSGNDIKITFPDKNIKPVIFKDFNTKIDTDEHISAALGIQMLESAYKEITAVENKIKDSMESIEGGIQFIPYIKFTGNACDIKSYKFENKKYEDSEKEKEKLNITIDKMIENIKEVKALYEKEGLSDKVKMLIYIKKIDYLDFDNKIRILKEMKKYYKYIKFIPESDKIKLLIEQSKKPDAILSCGTKNDKETVGIKEKSIYPGHAYSILSVNKKEGTVKVVNPWNCAQSIKLTFEEFDKNFCMINVTKVKKES